MKLNETFKFPYPVLSPSSDDYPGCSVVIELEISEKPASGSLEISYELRISADEIASLVQSHAAKCFLSVVCLETFYNEMFPMDEMQGIVRVSEGLLSGRVLLRGILTTTNAISFESAQLHSEYEGAPITLDGGAVIGWTEPQFISVGMEKLSPMESVFRLALNPDLPEGAFGIALDQEFITVFAATELFGSIHAMRNNSLTKPVVLNSVYVPAVMAIIESVKIADESFSDKRWYRVIQAKADFLSLDLATGDSLGVAQKLLKYPAVRLTEFVRRIG